MKNALKHVQVLKDLEENLLLEDPTLQPIWESLEKIVKHNQMLLDTGVFTPCECCNQAIRVEHNSEEEWDNFEAQHDELERLIGNGPPEWYCSEECIQTRINELKAQAS